jgi:hypothetical protein
VQAPYSHRKIAAYLMILSGITHPAQILVYGARPEISGPAMQGTLFLLVGALLLTRYRAALWIAVVLPLMGGAGAVYRIAALDPTAFTYFHALIDFVVVGLAIKCLAQPKNEPDGNLQNAGPGETTN